MQVWLKNEVDILVITETKLDSSFPDSQFFIDGFRQPYHLEINKHGGVLLIFVSEELSAN